MPDVPCGLSSLTHTVWHMMHLTLFSLQHATLCVLMHNEKWLKTMFHWGACSGSSRAEHIGEIQVILLKPCFKELTDRPPVCCVTSVHEDIQWVWQNNVNWFGSLTYLSYRNDLYVSSLPSYLHPNFILWKFNLGASCTQQVTLFLKRLATRCFVQHLTN